MDNTNLNSLKKYKTCELCKELATRQAVKEIFVEPYHKYRIETSDIIESSDGPVVIYIVTD